MDGSAKELDAQYEPVPLADSLIHPRRTRTCARCTTRRRQARIGCDCRDPYAMMLLVEAIVFFCFFFGGFFWPGFFLTFFLAGFFWVFLKIWDLGV